jgi:hypothetical protein
MKGQNLDWDGLLTFKMTSPFALQSIFLTLSIPEQPPFTGNIVSPGDFHVQAGGEGFEVKREPKVVDPNHS